MLWFHKQFILKVEASTFLIWLPWRPSCMKLFAEDKFNLHLQKLNLKTAYSDSTTLCEHCISEGYLLMTGWRTTQSSCISQKVKNELLGWRVGFAKLSFKSHHFEYCWRNEAVQYTVTLPGCFPQQRGGQRVMDRGERSCWLALPPARPCFIHTWPAGSCRQRPPERSRDAALLALINIWAYGWWD